MGKRLNQDSFKRIKKLVDMGMNYKEAGSFEGFSDSTVAKIAAADSFKEYEGLNAQLHSRKVSSAGRKPENNDKLVEAVEGLTKALLMMTSAIERQTQTSSAMLNRLISEPEQTIVDTTPKNTPRLKV